MTTWVAQAALAVTSRLDLAILAKVTIVLAFGLATLPFASKAQASLRHLLIAATFGTVLLLPLVMRTVPALTIHVPVAVVEPAADVARNEALNEKASANRVFQDDSVGGVDTSLPSFAMVVRFVWATGSIILLVLLAIDLLRLRALRRGGLPWLAQRDLTRSLLVTSGVRCSVDVLLHERVSAPLTCGLWRPTILLPIDASDWQEADLRRALLHELEHVGRRDWATQLVARVVCACYWFHPLVWTAWRRLCLEAERACDDAVLQSAESTDYAEQLVSLARRISTTPAFSSLAMAHRSDLSARVVALLDGTRRRGRVGFTTTASVVAVVCLVAFAVASIRAIAAPPPSTQAAHAAQPARGSVVVSQPPDRDARNPHPVRPLVTSVNPKRATRQRARRAIGERPTVWRDSAGNTETIPRVIDAPVGGIASGQSTMSNSSSESSTATHSGSASSSSNGARR